MAIGEQKEVARERILLQYTLHPCLQSVKALAQIHRFQSHENAGRRRYVQHDDCRLAHSERIHVAVAVAPNRTRIPPGSTTSAAHAPAQA